MINKISFKNYKAFVCGEIEIKPITILLGANSVGKSSLMQLLLMLQQTATSEKGYKSALKLHGGFVSMGEGLNLFRKKDVSKVLTISLDFQSDRLYKELKSNYFRLFRREFLDFIILFVRFFGKKKGKLEALTLKTFPHLRTGIMHINDDDKKISNELFHEYVNLSSEEFSKIDKKKLQSIYSGNFPFYGFRGQRKRIGLDYLKILVDKKDEYLVTVDFLEELTTNIKKGGQFNISYDIVIEKKIMILKKVSFASGKKVFLNIEFGSGSDGDIVMKSIDSKYLKPEDITEPMIKSLQSIFVHPRNIFSFVADIDSNEEKKLEQSPFANTIHCILNLFNETVSANFKNDNINYVSPLRAHPKRYYFLDKANINAYVNTLDGDAITETLKENSHLRKQVNEWLERFQLNVSVEKVEDFIHRLRVKQNDLDLDITDVGFGISQVLPVIIQGFLSHENSLTLIEQPEIHLHPKMQADLADLFIDIVIPKKTKKASKYLLIETHSEYLLKRLRRRISDGSLSQKNVAIYLINPEKEGSGAIIKKISIGQYGEFEWPVDFYGGELLNDTIEFLKNQK
jgi:predicted ATPase